MRVAVVREREGKVELVRFGDVGSRFEETFLLHERENVCRMSPGRTVSMITLDGLRHERLAVLR